MFKSEEIINVKGDGETTAKDFQLGASLVIFSIFFLLDVFNVYL